MSGWATSMKTHQQQQADAQPWCPHLHCRIYAWCSPALGAHKLVSLRQHQQVRQRLLLGVQACRVAGDVERGMPSFPRARFTHSGASLPCSRPHS